jgi:ubiquinone/menaquinone biosynthesis C-methylase UbiE
MQEWKEKRQTMRHYDKQAAIYNVQYLDEQTAKIKDVLKRINVNSKEVVLDLGCGTGFLFRHITKKVEFIVGLDLSQKALQEAKKSTKNMSNIALVQADADNIPFQNHIFDKVFALTILQNMPNPTKTIIEIKRTSKPQVKIAVTGLKKKFTTENFVTLLESSQLKVETLSSNKQLKGHIH